MRFLHQHAFQTPYWLMEENILENIQYAGALDRIRGYQVRFLNRLMDMGRMQRLIEAEAFKGKSAYGLMDMCKELRQGLWSELRKGSAIDIGRRNLQRAYIERMEYILNEEQPNIPAQFRAFVARTNVDVSQSDIRPVVKAELRTLHEDITKAVKKTSDEMTKIHLEDCLERIEKAL